MGGRDDERMRRVPGVPVGVSVGIAVGAVLSTAGAAEAGAAGVGLAEGADVVANGAQPWYATHSTQRAGLLPRYTLQQLSTAAGHTVQPLTPTGWQSTPGEGAAVGLVVGAVVGAAVGAAVGATVGAVVGAFVNPTAGHGSRRCFVASVTQAAQTLTPARWTYVRQHTPWAASHTLQLAGSQLGAAVTKVGSSVGSIVGAGVGAPINPLNGTGVGAVVGAVVAAKGAQP
jgi:hypothetical protein